MKILVGTSNGQVKIVQVENKKESVWNVQEKDSSVDQLLFLENYHQTEDSFYFLCSRSSGDKEKVTQLNLLESFGGLQNLISVKGGISLDGIMRGIINLSTDSTTSLKTAVCSDSGKVSILQYGESGKENLWSSLTSFQTSSPISKMKQTPIKSRIILGGEENDTAIYDLENQKQIWKAKNVPNDFLDMRVPIWVRDMDFLDESSNNFIVGTFYNQIRTYDIRSGQRKPINDLKLKELENAHLNSILLDKSKNFLSIGDNQGGTRIYDIRNSSKIFANFRGTAGAVTDIVFHKGKDLDMYMATSSLDRHARIFNWKKKGLLHKIYLKQQLSCIMFTSHGHQKIEEKKKKLSDDEDNNWEEDPQFFKDMNLKMDQFEVDTSSDESESEENESESEENESENEEEAEIEIQKKAKFEKRR